MCLFLICPSSFGVFNVPRFILWSAFFACSFSFPSLFFPRCSTSLIFLLALFPCHQRVNSFVWNPLHSPVSVLISMFIPLPFTWHWLPCVTSLEMDLKGLKRGWSSAHPWEAWHRTPPCVQGCHHWGACFTFCWLWRRCFHSFLERFFIKQTCTLPDQKGIMWTFYEPNVEINGGKKEMLEMWVVHRCLLLTPRQNTVNHTSHRRLL